MDAGLTYTVLSPELINELGLIITPYKVDLTLADKRELETGLFLVEVEAEGRRGSAFVI